MGEKYFFIVNQTARSGKAKDMWKTITQKLAESNIDYSYRVTEYEGHARELAKEMCDKADAEHPIRLVVLGGDGTANEVIDGMHNFENVYFGYIPSGSGNDLARGMGICGTPQENLSRILECSEPVAMDLGEVCYVRDEDKTTHKFAISAGVGIDADVCKQALTSKLKSFLNFIGLGSLTYILLTIKSIFTMPTTNAEISFDGGEKRRISDVIFVVAMNHKCEGGGVKMVPHADAYDGKLSVLVVSGIKRAKAFILLPFLKAGKHLKFKGFEAVECSSYELKTADAVVLHTDGEYGGEPRHILVKCLPGRLKTLV